MMEIKVTQDHIDNGVADSCFECPVALALVDAGVQGVSVNQVRIEYTRYGGVCSIQTPEEVSGFIFDFDDETVRHECRPFTFELDC